MHGIPGRVELAEKTKRLWDKIEIVYDRERWNLLRQYRQKALQILQSLERNEIYCFVHGSVVRGDVDEQSDIDIITAQQIPSQKIEISFLSLGYKIYSRKITQATPRHALKGHIFLDSSEKISMTFPLFPFRKLEYEFYKFGGILDRKGVEKEIRAPGCTKRLTFIEPTKNGHHETGIKGREAEIAKTLNISLEIVQERSRVLTRRDRVGRTGVFLNIDLPSNESFDRRVMNLIDSNPAVRRAYHQREKK